MNDSYARQVLRAGIDCGISPAGIVIGFATVFVESTWLMYANAADPESLVFPHDALSQDANSVGLFQQRAPWWGSCADRMDPYRSAQMFFTQLKRFDYTNPAHTPGWYAQQVQGSEFPDRYDQHLDEAQQLYDRLTTVSEKAMEKVLDYPRGPVGDYDGVVQRKPWDCGPASVQVILQAAGISKTEDWLIDQIGTTVDGTNSAECCLPVLNALLGSDYRAMWLSREPVTPAQIDALWSAILRSVNGGRGVLLNFEVPPSQPIRTSRGSTPPPYPSNQTIYHYTAGMGVAVDPDGSRHVWVADPAAFGGITGYWCRVEEIARLIVPHAIAYAANPPAPAAPTPAPTPPPPAPVDKLATLWLEWNAITFGDPESVAAIVTAAKSGDARALRTLAKLEQSNPAALQQFIATKGAAA